MHNNFKHMIMSVVVFLLVNLLFMGMLYCYRNGSPNVRAHIYPWLDHFILKTNFFKLCFLFAFVYFSGFIFFKNTGITCQDLDPAAQCQCYALELAHEKNLAKQLSTAKYGMQHCKAAKFFPDFIRQHS